MRFVQVEVLTSGKVLVDIDNLTHTVPQESRTHLFLGAQQLDVSHTLNELEDVLAGRVRGDNGDVS